MNWKAFLRRNKLPAVTACILLCVLAWSFWGRAEEADALLYLGMVNVNLSKDLTGELTTGFLPEGVKCYQGLYLTSDPDSEYYDFSRASSVRIVGSIERQVLDVVILNREAFDAFAQNGYLLNLDTFLPTDSPLRSYMVSNIEILEDNMDEVRWDPTVTYSAVTDEYPMALELSASAHFQAADLNGPAYIAVLANSPRLQTAEEYLRYVFA